MKNQSRKLLLLLFSVGLALLLGNRIIPATVASPVSRKFQFNYAVHVPPMKAPEGKLLLWLPLPQDDKYQKIEDLHIDGSVKSRQGHDPSYNNPYVEFA